MVNPRVVFLSYTFFSTLFMLAQQPHIQPSPSELEDMSQHALAVVRLLEELQRLDLAEGGETRVDSDPMHQSPDDPRHPNDLGGYLTEEGASMPDPNLFLMFVSLNPKLLFKYSH